MSTVRRLAVAAVALAAAGPVAAQPAKAAPAWIFVDGAGVAHLAAERPDARYLPLHPASTGQPADRVPGKTADAASLQTWLEVAPEVRALRPWLREAAAAHGVDELLLKALIAVESGFDPRAVSPAGAVGLMQILPSTADRYATPQERRLPAAERLLDARTNIHTGARMLADLLQRFGRIDAALAAWNAGEGTVRRHGGALPPLAETRAHVEQVLQLYWRLLQREQALRATTLKLPGR